jgi:hypothetical protein
MDVIFSFLTSNDRDLCSKKIVYIVIHLPEKQMEHHKSIRSIRFGTLFIAESIVHLGRMCGSSAINHLKTLVEERVNSQVCYIVLEKRV